MRNKNYVAIFPILIACLFVICSCAIPESDSADDNMDSLNIQIGPPSKIAFVKLKSQLKSIEQKSWEFDLPVVLINCGKNTLYIPNPEYRYSSWGSPEFFLINRDDITMYESIKEAVLIFGNTSWKKLNPSESIRYSNHIVISQIEESDAPNKTIDMQSIEFYSYSGLSDKYKIKPGKYKLFARFAYEYPQIKDQKIWLEQVHLPVNNVELSRFWHGKIESNYLDLELKEE